MIKCGKPTSSRVFYCCFRGILSKKESLTKMKTQNKILIIFSSVFVFIIGALIFILPHESFSSKENRYLTTLSKPTSQSILNGDFSKNISSFYADQIPFRNYSTALYALCEKALGKNEINGVISYGSHLITRSKQKEAPSTNFDAIWIESKYSLFKSGSQDLSLYYKTDHHRNAKGAYLLYLNACEKLGVVPFEENYFTKQTVSTDFFGTAFSRSCLPAFLVKPDTITLYRYLGDDSVKITVHDSGRSFLGFYDFSKLDNTDKYALFLGGNYAHATVFSSSEKPTLLLVKDSFANAVVPLLALHFNIELIDPRYSSPAKISNLVSNLNYDSALILACYESFS